MGALLQDGVDHHPGYKLYAWFEHLSSNRLHTIYETAFTSKGKANIQPHYGDRIRVVTRWDSSRSRAYYYAYNLSRKGSNGKYLMVEYDEQLTSDNYNGATAEFIDERPSDSNFRPLALSNFRQATWGAARVTDRNGKATDVGRRVYTYLDMQNFDASGARAGRLMAAVPRLRSTHSWTDKYHNCAP